MILYQKSKTPYFIRLLTVIFHPASFVMLPIVGGLCYWAYASTIQPPEQTGMLVGIYFAVLVVGFFVWMMYSGMLAGIKTKLVLVEILPSGLRVQQLSYDTLNETIFTANELNLEARRVVSSSRSEDGSTRNSTNVYFYLKISGKDESKPSYTISDSQMVIGEMLEKIDQQKLIPLKAGEQDFLRAFQSQTQFENSPTGKITWIAWRVGILAFIFFIGYKAKDPMMKLINAFRIESHPIHGVWQVSQQGSWNVVTINSDSSFSEAIDYVGAKWKYVPEDSSSHRPAKFSVSTMEGSDELRVVQYEVLSLNDSVMDLKRDSDKKLFHMTKYNQSYVVSRVNSLVGIFEQTFLMTVPQSVRVKLLKDMIPEWQNDQVAGAVLVNGFRYVFALSGYSGASLAVFDSETEELLSYETFPNTAADVCIQSFSIVKQDDKDIIQMTTQCEALEESTESKPVNLYRQLDESGKLIAADYINKESTPEWSTSEAFINFPKKWYLLHEGANGLERQQMCGGEAFTEIVQTEKGFIWHDQGYLDMAEELIQNFGVAESNVSEYRITVGDRVIPVFPDNIHPGATWIGDRLYTSKPDLFPVENDTSECL